MFEDRKITNEIEQDTIMDNVLKFNETGQWIYNYVKFDKNNTYNFNQFNKRDNS